MAEQMVNYQCPACTGPLHFSVGSGKLECDYCGSVFEIAEIEALYQSKEEQAAEAQAQAEAKIEQEKQELPEGWDFSALSQWDTENGMKSYSCPSCGAELICEDSTAATACPYCGNPTVVPGQFSGGYKPDFIIPFGIDKQQAQQELKKFYKGKRFMPHAFAVANKIKNIQGVYVPFWLFDGQADASAEFNSINSREYIEGAYTIKETEYYEATRAASIPFEKIPVDASKAMPDKYMDAIEPFDYSKLQPFSTAYLPGFLANKYDETAEQCVVRADRRVENTAIGILRNDVTNYQSVQLKSHQVTLERGKVHYGLLPVYLMTTKWGGKEYLFAVNGQTGKLAGNLPIDPKKYWLWFAGIAGSVTAIFGSLLMWMFW